MPVSCDQLDREAKSADCSSQDCRSLGEDLHLYKQTDNGSVQHAGTNELEVRRVFGFEFEFDPLLDLFVFTDDKGAFRVAVSVCESENLTALLPAVFGRQPARGFGQEHHAKEE